MLKYIAGIATLVASSTAVAESTAVTAHGTANVEVTPPTIEPAVPVAIASIQGVFAGYRSEAVDGRLMNGLALRVVWGRNDTPLELEFTPSQSWGGDENERVGRFGLSLGLRYVANKRGSVRPHVVAAPLLSVVGTRMDGERTTRFHAAVGGHAGLGVDIDLSRPAALSIDVRGGRTMRAGGNEPASWELCATLAIGLYFGDTPTKRNDGTQASVPVI